MSLTPLGKSQLAEDGPGQRPKPMEFGASRSQQRVRMVECCVTCNKGCGEPLLSQEDHDGGGGSREFQWSHGYQQAVLTGPLLTDALRTLRNKNQLGGHCENGGKVLRALWWPRRC